MATATIIKVRRLHVPLDPSTEVFHVVVKRGEGEWHETCNTEELVRAFLRGVQAGSSEHVPLPEIPVNAEALEIPDAPSDDIPF